ncbi:MAG TPA: endonuclease IV, partial [Clostridiales bacterium]|nr:endonuclease IV [Clostridiales bacterium]
YEYPCSKGVNIGELKANQIGSEAAKYGIRLSIHAPYYINFASDIEENLMKSRKWLTDSMVAATWMGADRVVFHPGSATGIDRKIALTRVNKQMQVVLKEAEELGVDHITLCPELMGKVNQLGTLEEVIQICKTDDRLTPCIDFGHLHARDFGRLNSTEDFEIVIRMLWDQLGRERGRGFHCHFSRIEYTAKGGEKKHHTFADKEYGPDFDLLVPLIYKYDLLPVFICESNGTMAKDALEMKKLYESYQR